MAESAKKVGRGMGPKPVDQVQQAQGCQYPLEAIWQAVRELKKFSRADIAGHLAKLKISGVNDHTIDSYVDRLRRGNYIACCEIESVRGIATRSIFEMVNDCGREAPRLRKDGSPSLLGMGTDQMWRAMKVLGDFTYRDLVLAATTEDVQVTEDAAKSYIKNLVAAGYLVKRSGSGPQPVRYRLRDSMKTGPLPQMVQRTKRVYDQNLKKVVWREDQ